MKNVIPIVTIDGPNGVGKGTLSRRLANILGWNLLDSGIIYRILALIALSKNINVNNENHVMVLVSKKNVNLIYKINQFFMFCNSKRIKENIYTEMVGNIASKIAMLSTVRASLLEYQRTFCMLPGLIADGRDMGTIVFPNAILKIFLYASLKVREQRRLDQLQKTNFNANLSFLLEQMRERDKRDYDRALAPLVPAVDALMLDSTDLSSIEVENIVLKHIKKKLMLSCGIII